MLRWAPSNLLLDRIRTRRGLKWGVPAMLLAAPLLLSAAICSELAKHDGYGALYLLALLLIWDAFKFLMIGPISLILLGVVMWRESRSR